MKRMMLPEVNYHLRGRSVCVSVTDISNCNETFRKQSLDVYLQLINLWSQPTSRWLPAKLTIKLINKKNVILLFVFT